MEMRFDARDQEDLPRIALKRGGETEIGSEFWQRGGRQAELKWLSHQLASNRQCPLATLFGCCSQPLPWTAFKLKEAKQAGVPCRLRITWCVKASLTGSGCHLGLLVKCIVDQLRKLTALMADAPVLAFSPAALFPLGDREDLYEPYNKCMNAGMFKKHLMKPRAPVSSTVAQP